MERKAPVSNKEKYELMEKYSESSKGLVSALAVFVRFRYDSNRYETLWGAFEKATGKAAAEISAEDFLCRDMTKAFAALAGEEMAAKLPDILGLFLEGPFSHSLWRRSYRSKQFAFYRDSALNLMGNLVLQSTYEPESVLERLSCSEAAVYGFEYILALEIRRGSKEIISALHEAIMGDNSRVLLSREIINAIVISGHEGLLDDLMKLLLAAKLQEGLRQQILEAADKGSNETLAKILKVCLDNNLFRYSAAIRAFDVWSGMGYGDSKPAHIQKYAQLAYDCLSDESKRQECYRSDNNVEVYFSLWALGCREFTATLEEAARLLDDAKHYRRVLGWLFVSRTDSSRFQMALAARHLEERDEELLAWITGNLARTWSLFRSNWRVSRRFTGQSVTNPALPAEKEARRQLFYQLQALAAFIGNKKRSFTGNPFDFVSVTLESTRVYDCMIALAGYDMDRELTDALLDAASQMNVEQRQSLLCVFLQPDSSQKHRDYLLNCLNDRSIMVKELAVDRLADCTLTGRDLDALADALRSKSSSLRAAIVTVFKKLDAGLLLPLIEGMLASAEENQNQAAIELLGEMKEQHPEWLNVCRTALDSLSERKISTQTRILLDQLPLGEKEEEVYTPENGYGLYDPNAVKSYLASVEQPIKKTGLLSRVLGSNDLYSAREIKTLIPSWDELDQLLGRLNQVFIRHADEEIEVLHPDGSRGKILFGDYRNRMPLSAETGHYGLSCAGARLEMIPFWKEFREALGEYAVSIPKMLGLFLLTSRGGEVRYPGAELTYSSFYRPIADLDHPWQLFEKFRSKYKSIFQLAEIFDRLPLIFDSRKCFPEILKMYRSMVSIWGEENLSRVYWQFSENARSRFVAIGNLPEGISINNRTLALWRRAVRTLELSREDFARWFALEYRLEQGIPSAVYDALEAEDYCRAYCEGIIPKDVLLAYLLSSHSRTVGHCRILSNPMRWAQGRTMYEKYPFLHELMPIVFDRIVTVEEKRGELRTPLSSHCFGIERLEGARHFCNLLAALGKESFFRGYEYSANDSKKGSLSRLLKCCYPAKTDTPEELAVLLKETDISDKRLVEAVMYAPQWAGFAEKILNWPGLKCGVWFFHAHINERFSAEKETETAIFSPISPQQFNDGAFDKHWFFEAYEQLGEKRFQILYKSAKYITAGSNQHRRSQLYADAVLGKLDTQELLQEITEKRNREKLRCYPLIPIAEGDTQEALRRYEFIQNFLKESKQFGAQRRESEKKACATALENLAITTGLMDVNRLMWQMESQKIEELRPMMVPVSLEGVELRLNINESGDAGIIIEKNGKALKNLPKSFAKNESYLALKSTVKELKALKQRSRESMERAMAEGTLFGGEELQNILGNPVLAPMLRNLLWTNGTVNGFLRETPDGMMLLRADGSVTAAAQLRIAHPHDLRTAGDWTQFMALLYENQLVQPFKQVFREYYPITEDERQERTVSRRYAGHQVQPQRTAALLKSRGWTVDYEEGLQKVFYRENLIVRMYAMAEWFSPADIEPPTLETVEFFDRRSQKNVPLEDVPPILFSETMRDLDMVVSIAHVGGVDPEASHSTVEMRLAIAAELVKLLKLRNVCWVGSHAKIHGSLTNYSVHMGSGVVHAEGIGMLSIIPVHSQSRGRIFLPFADDDPKTAEIMSKILLLAEDTKIKDPTILLQIAR